MPDLALNARRDPTRSAVLRQQYVANCTRRFKKIMKLITTTVVENDALRLSTPTSPIGILSENAKPAGRYDFPSDPAGKAEAFMAWLQEMADQEILEVIRWENRKAIREEWQNLYVRAAYGKAITSADGLLKREGLDIPDEVSVTAVFGFPIHANTLALLYTRNFNELKGITDAMSQQISRTLTEGMARGLNPKQIAKMLTQRVDSIGIYRATLMARTEIIRAYAEGTLNRFEEHGLDSVEGRAEIQTAGDHRVCPTCKSLDHQVFTIQQARGMIPLHPQCRCAWLPVIYNT